MPRKSASLPQTAAHRASAQQVESTGIAAASDDPFARFLCFSVYSTGLAFNRVYKPLLDRLGLTYLQYLVLVALAQHDGRRVSEIGDALALESNTLTPLIKRMEAAGLVSRRRDSVDERVVIVSLTGQGRETVNNAMACVPEQVIAATGMTIEELDRLNRDLQRLRDHLREDPVD